MILAPHETERFYRIWTPLLQFVNQKRKLVAPFSTTSVPGKITIPLPDAVKLRDALWEDDALREAFIAENPAELSGEDLGLVASWQYRVAGNFFIFKHLKKHSIFLDDSSPATAYTVVGLVSPIEDIVGPYLPIMVQTVLLPFENQIIYDSLMAPYSVTFGGGIRSSLKDAYRDAQERGNVLTSLLPEYDADDPDKARQDLTARNDKLLKIFQKHLATSGLSLKMIEQHSGQLALFAKNYMLAQEPPLGLLDISSDDLKAYLNTPANKANPVSFKRFVRFLYETERIDPDTAAKMNDFLKSVKG